ncbi:zinc finger domain-containing protein [Endobacterium cereale]|uniref:zinc finger domain-containing protein n=1 Tax=Endobacterium cereale TaxID=2663029 RepID=UPI002B49CAD8|nr:zinc finger domain-containing protein [Endobacterium cereale]MEB2848192.1 zinc finger domain-containing protein [Endobacterium cereale]
MPTIISEFEAAAITAMSPELLRWFSGHAPKSGSKRKLKVAEQRDGVFFYDHDEVVAFDQWLKMPWPRKDGNRPGIPSAIKKEIKVEAGGECVICHKHDGVCEAAHIKPVAKTDNNHPENLIWLCSTHHTAFDKGFFKPVAEEEEFVPGFKLALRRYRVMLWRNQHKGSATLFAVLDTCDHLEKQLSVAKTTEQLSAVKTLAKKTLKLLPDVAAVSKSDPKFANIQTLSKGVEGLKAATGQLKKKLRAAQALRLEYVATFGFVACPLCKGSGHHDYGDCPVCHGDREIEPALAARVELSDFKKVKCPVCLGRGSNGGFDCLACGGEREMDRRFADEIVVSDFTRVDCPICQGKGMFRGRSCQACGGEGDLERRHADEINVREYEVVECPFGNGSGQHRHMDCPECGGDGELLSKDAAEVRLSDYSQRKCELCRGSGQYHDRDCPACGGEGRLEARHAADTDWTQFEEVRCPACRGKGVINDYDCGACGGEGRVEKRFVDEIDPSEYQ